MPFQRIRDTERIDITYHMLAYRQFNRLVFHADYVACDTVNQPMQLGTLPDGYVIQQSVALGTNNCWIVPLFYRGPDPAAQGYLAVYVETRNVYLWTTTTNKYYAGQLTVSLVSLPEK